MRREVGEAILQPLTNERIDHGNTLSRLEDSAFGT